MVFFQCVLYKINETIKQQTSMNFQVNRFTLLLNAFAAIMVYVFFSTNVYLNALLIVSGGVFVGVAFAYIEEECTLNEKEKNFLKKLSF